MKTDKAISYYFKYRSSRYNQTDNFPVNNSYGSIRNKKFIGFYLINNTFYFLLLIIIGTLISNLDDTGALAKKASVINDKYELSGKFKKNMSTFFQTVKEDLRS